MSKIQADKRSILISRVMVYFFTLVLITMDATGWWIGMRLEGAALLRHVISSEDSLCFLTCLYTCSIPAYIVLYGLHKLLIRVASGKVFVPGNVKILRVCSWCLFAAAAICLIGTLWLPILLIIVAAAGFMGLIVRIIMNVFVQAISMKEELDLTV